MLFDLLPMTISRIRKIFFARRFEQLEFLRQSSKFLILLSKWSMLVDSAVKDVNGFIASIVSAAISSLHWFLTDRFLQLFFWSPWTSTIWSSKKTIEPIVSRNHWSFSRNWLVHSGSQKSRSFYSWTRAIFLNKRSRSVRSPISSRITTVSLSACRIARVLAQFIYFWFYLFIRYERIFQILWIHQTPVRTCFQWCWRSSLSFYNFCCQYRLLWACFLCCTRYCHHWCLRRRRTLISRSCIVSSDYLSQVLCWVLIV